MLYLIQQNENTKFHKSAKEYARIRILDRPKKRLDAMIDLRTKLFTVCDEFFSKVKKVTDRIASEIYDPDADEGLLEVDKEKYMNCFNVDLRQFDKLLEEEITVKKNELQQAEKSASSLILKMQGVLQTSQEDLKTFLEGSKYQVDCLSKSKSQRDNVKKEEFKEKMI